MEIITTLSELTGSEKQITWAETIREKAITEINQMIEQVIAAGEPTSEDDKAAVKQIADSVAKATAETKSSFWIDNRGMSGRQILRQAAGII
jgi:hypothetical protein